MNPQISEISETNGIYEFTLSKINVSLANALRRIILSDIPTVVVRTEIYATNQCKIEINTGRLHNEIIKQRLSCIPIHSTDLSQLPGKYVLEVNVNNDTDNIMYVTTEHFKIRNKENGNYLKREEVQKIFPPCSVAGNSYIDFVRLRPKISDSIPGEQIKLSAEFSIGNALENSMFNVVSKCTYGNTPDKEKIMDMWQKQEDQLRTQDNVKEADIEFKKKNFMLLDAQRIFKEESFDFQIKSVGVYDNREIVKIGTKILYEKFLKMVENLDANLVPILNSETTMDFCFDIMLEDEDYTMGKVIEYFLYEKYYIQEKTLSFCGFKKFHPHDTKSTVRIAFSETADKTMTKQYVRSACMDAQEVFKVVYKLF
jgi:DNA-directed RNA polymerase II subunit RPB3